MNEAFFRFQPAPTFWSASTAMKKYILCALVAVTLFLGLESVSDAKPVGFHLDATLGSSYTFNPGGPDGIGNPLGNFGSSLEITPSVRFLMLSADLGVNYDFLQNNFTLRPGVRMFLGWFYFRAAIPLAFHLSRGVQSELFDMGILVGAGARVTLGKWAIVAEANVSPMFLHISERGVSMPAEFRLGVAYNF